MSRQSLLRNKNSTHPLLQRKEEGIARGVSLNRKSLSSIHHKIKQDIYKYLISVDIYRLGNQWICQKCLRNDSESQLLLLKKMRTCQTNLSDNPSRYQYCAINYIPRSPQTCIFTSVSPPSKLQCSGSVLRQQAVKISREQNFQVFPLPWGIFRDWSQGLGFFYFAFACFSEEFEDCSRLHNDHYSCQFYSCKLLRRLSLCHYFGWKKKIESCLPAGVN